MLAAAALSVVVTLERIRLRMNTRIDNSEKHAAMIGGSQETQEEPRLSKPIQLSSVKQSTGYKRDGATWRGVSYARCRNPGTRWPRH